MTEIELKALEERIWNSHPEKERKIGADGKRYVLVEYDPFMHLVERELTEYAQFIHRENERVRIPHKLSILYPER